VKWYRKAAEQGSTDAHIFLGDMYENEWGVDKMIQQQSNISRSSGAKL